VDFEADNLGSDEECIYQYLKLWPDQFVSGIEISRRADSKTRFLENPSWAGSALGQLLGVGLIETDGDGRYRLRAHSTVMVGGKSKFIAPELMEILIKSGQKFDIRAQM
jgi:hypothetical protein